MKKNFTIFRNVMMLICALLLVQNSIAQRMNIAGWSFPEVSPNYASTCPADCGDGTIYLDGTHGSSQWTIVSNTSGVSNAAHYASTGLQLTNTITTCEDGVRGQCLTLVGCDDSCIVFVFATTNLQNIMLSYDTQLSGTAYKSVTWSHSTDGVNFVDDTTLTYTNTSTLKTSHIIDFSNADDLTNQSVVYLRVSGTASTSTNGGGTYRFDNILISGESDVPSAIQPIFSVSTGNFCAPIDVTMSSATDNASIYYTTDGTTPDNVNGTLYTGAIHIEATTTLHAIAYADGLAASFETSATYTFPSDIATISDFKALDGDDNYYRLTCPVTAVFQNGSYLFVEDATHTGLCIYKQGGFATNYYNGDIITGGICGTNKSFSNTTIQMIELSNPEFINPTATQGTPVEPVAVTMAQLRTNWDTYESRLVTLNGVTFAQGTFSSSTSNYLKIYQGTDSLGCINTLGTLSGVTVPTTIANVTGFAIYNNTLRKIAPRGASDIVDLLPTLSIASPTEGQVIEQGSPVQVDLDILNFDFENGSMIEGKLLINGQAVTTQYITNAAQLAGFEAMDLSTLMTTYGDYTLIASLVNADYTQFATPATDTVHFTYMATYIAIETSETSLEFSETGESHTIAVRGFHLDEAIAITVDNSNFTVNPSSLPANAENDSITVTFTGTASAVGTLTLSSGTTTATVALNAVLPIDELIHSVGFEASEGFGTSTVYNNDNPAYYGPDGQQWGTIHGAVTATASVVIVGSQSLQMRYYCDPSNQHYGHIGYAYTNYDIHNVTKVEFDSKVTTNSNLTLKVSFSHDGGETYEGDSIFNTTATAQHFTYHISDSGQYYSVRVKFEMVLPEVVTQTSGNIALTIDAVDFYGVTGMEANVVETPVISEPSGTYTNPLTVTISCATENARIYYTTDGTTPTESSTLYESALTIDSTCTLKATAFKGGMDPSNTAIAEYNFPVVVATIADFKEAGELDNTATYKITGDITFVYRNGRRIFIEDATGGLLVYDNNSPVVTGSYNEGDVISGGVIGTYHLYNGMVELVPTANWAEASGNVTVTPTVATAADITENFATYEARLVRVNAGTFAEEASFNTSEYTEATLTDETGDIVVRNQFKTLDTIVNAGDTVDVIGFAAIYATGGNTTYQIFPRTNADIIPVITEPADTTNPDDTVSIHTFVPVILSVWPNPATDVITVSADQDGGSLEILNAFGQVVYRANAPVYPTTVDMTDKATGLYFVRVITADRRIAVIKVTKE